MSPVSRTAATRLPSWLVASETMGAGCQSTNRPRCRTTNPSHGGWSALCLVPLEPGMCVMRA